MAMRIRELAAQAGTTTRTLRYYEAQGLLPTGRSANGYRVYDEHHVRLVREIRSLPSATLRLLAANCCPLVRRATPEKRNHE
jgi:DNA-binding transcriptional MerR regulator